jgi:adenine-specific DNA-methyltransferase
VTKVSIGGSRRITRLDAEVRRRLDRIIERRRPVVVGDANGADKAVQRYLSGRKFGTVEVFSAGATPRNNVGKWPVCVIRPRHDRKDFDYYAAKDRAMAAAATVGLMLWDGQSRGTLMNVLRLADQRKAVVVYVQGRGSLKYVQDDLAALLSQIAGAPPAVRPARLFPRAVDSPGGSVDWDRRRPP